MKRQDYINWDQYFMGIALLSAKRSKDPHTQVGACIVNEDKKIVGIGYNGLPNGISDDDFNWDRYASDELDSKYPYVCHAELNAILNSHQDLTNCSIYVTLFPCNECCKLIIQSKIKNVYYLDDKGFNTTSEQASLKMFNQVGIKHQKIEKPNIIL